MGAQEWVYGLTIYFISIFIFVTLFSIAGVFTEVQATGVTTTMDAYQSANASQMSTVTTGFSWTRTFKDVFSFFVFNISISHSGVIMDYFWLFRIILVYVPLAFLVLALYYSAPFTSGG